MLGIRVPSFMPVSAGKGIWGMIGVDLIGQIRRAFFDQRRPIKEIVRTLSVSRSTVRKVIRGQETEFRYARGVQPARKLGEWIAALTEILEAEARLPKRERRSTQRLFEELRGRGYEGAHDSVHRFAKTWREERARAPTHAFVPLSFAPGEAYQFDWSHETITLQGLPLMIKAAHMKLSHSRMPFVRDHLFRPKPRVTSLAELNGWLEDQCVAYAKRTKHPEFKERTIWEVFQDERASLIELRGPFDGFVEKAVRATTTCQIMADHNRYSVDARAAGRMVLVRSHAERIVVLLGDEVVADHPRQFRRDQIIYDPWHYLPVLMKKPGALRNGAPFKDWALPPALTQVRAKLKQHADGDRQFVKVLGAVLDHGMAAVEAACTEALEAGIASGDVILTVLARRRQPVAPPSITTPDALRLKIEPVADCGRYDSIRKIA